MRSALADRRVAREKLLHRISTTLQGDERFVAAWLIGSLGRNAGDELSDIDLVVVVDGSQAATLCHRPWMIGGQTTEERHSIFAQFGEPVIVHENNYNAPANGTFTSVTYRADALTVDWTLVPQDDAIRSADSRLLFSKSDVPVQASNPEATQEERAAAASEKVAFFWMMLMVAAKYMLRNDAVFFHLILHTLYQTLIQLAHLVEGNEWVYRSGSEAKLAPSQREQHAAIQDLAAQMQALMPKVVAMGGSVPSDPMGAVEVLLSLSQSRDEG